MKLTTLIITVCLLQVSAAGFSQRLTFNKNNASIRDVFKEIKKQTGYDVFYVKSMLPSETTVNAKFSNMGLAEVMNTCLAGTGLEYTIDEKTIVIRSAKNTDAVAFAEQQITLKGKVIDSLGYSLPGASVRVQGTNNSTTTNVDGEFQLSGVKKNALVSVSFIGYASQEIRVSSKNTYITVKLSPGASALQEVEISVNTGYQKLPKERSTGSFASVSSTKLDQQRLSNMSSLLEGRIPGYNNGLIRGTTSMRGVTSPLYVIDGFPIENKRYDTGGSITDLPPDLNLEDIETITVLKDAAAASIYGARAANGVVVIETKKAAKGKVQIKASSTITTQPYRYYTDRFTNSADIIELEKEWAAKNPNLQRTNAANYAANALQNSVYQSQGIRSLLNYYAGNISADQMNSTLNGLSQNGFAYYDDMTKFGKRDPFFQQYNLTLSSANDKNAFIASVTYRDNKQEDKYTDDNSLGINLRNTTQLNKWLNMEVGTYLNFTKGTEQSFNLLSPGYQFLPYDRLVNADGSNFTNTAASRYAKNVYDNIVNYGLYNMDITPLDEIGRNLSDSKGFTGRANIRMNAKITSWLNYSAMFQYEYGTDRYGQLKDKNSYATRSFVNAFATRSATNTAVFNLPYGNIFKKGDTYSNAYTFRQQLNFDKTIGDHAITAIAGFEMRENKNEYADRTLYNYDPQMMNYGMVNAQLLGSITGAIIGGATFNNYNVAYDQEVKNRFISVYGNAGYAYKDKYLFNGSIRLDRSNLWGTASKYQNTPIWSTGLGWNIHKENFFHVSWIDQLKLRTSLGIGGNIPKNTPPYMTATYYTNNNVGGIYGTIAQRPNPLLSWEKTTTWNLGLDYSLLNGRISGTVDYYNRSGKDLLANTQGVPTEGFGYTTYTINNGEMTNKGIELSLSGDIIRSKDFRWNAMAIYARNKNKITYVNIEAPVYFLQLDYPEQFPRIGNPYNSIYAYRWAGLSADGIAQARLSDGSLTTSAPSELKDIVYAGSTVPINSGSFNSTLSYKRFDLSFLMTFETGHKMQNTFLPILGSAYNSALGSYVTSISTVNREINNRWKNPGDEATTNIPRVVFAEDPAFNSNNITLYQRADINVISASNLRMRNISLAYRIPELWTRKAGISNARLQFNMENAFTVAASPTAKYLLKGYQMPSYVMGVYLTF